ncbi:hypothetical protein HMPREF3187_00603 [Aerococcus christensenii]|uniref:Uncharacterized protein n=1 Tax=Aerococcus christensenii TaxID=87541 RepID=A0A133Y296_9LACT|nr:hypothetical protein HMPREF3187_00603 [Aerococcus christensenii]
MPSLLFKLSLLWEFLPANSTQTKLAIFLWKGQLIYPEKKEVRETLTPKPFWKTVK